MIVYLVLLFKSFEVSGLPVGPVDLLSFLASGKT